MRNRFGIILSLTILVAALLGGWLGDKAKAGAPLEKGTEQLLENFTETLATLQAHYVRPVPAEELIESAIRGLVRTLDPHSSFFATFDYSRLQEEQQGKYYGLGIAIRAQAPGSGRVVIVEPPAPGTPAYKVGLKAGDIISKIEGESIEDWDINKEVIPNLKGPKGTRVNITVERPGEPEPIELTVERDEIPLYTVKYAFHIRPQIGYINMVKFSETTSKELDEALQELEEQKLQGLILDLRDNPGGALSQAIEVADRFLGKDQIIVSTYGRQGKQREYRAPKGRRYDYPMVLLINQMSASASEIVAGALQDHDRALIVGETSFGKALVQTIYPFPGNRGLALTTGKYYTPSGRLIQRDYSESFYDYFYSRTAQGYSGDQKQPGDEERAADGGGGIVPDVEVTLVAYSRLGRFVDRKNLFSEFAGKLAKQNGKSDLRDRYPGEELTPEEREEIKKEMIISEETMSSFREFLRDQRINFTDQIFIDNRDLIKSRLEQELFVELFEEQEGFKIALEIDPQVQKAVELMPQAEVLLQKATAEM